MYVNGRRLLTAAQYSIDEIDQIYFSEAALSLCPHSTVVSVLTKDEAGLYYLIISLSVVHSFFGYIRSHFYFITRIQPKK